MSIYSKLETGTKVFRSRYTKSISNKIRYNCTFHELIPVLKRFVLPGDVWRIGGEALVRFLPMVSPSMTPYELIARYFFVPLRQIEENTELIITGSQDGKLYESTLPSFPNFVANARKANYPHCYEVRKYTFWDYMNVQCGNYEPIKNEKCLPAEYWAKAYLKIYFDYYRDENYNSYPVNQWENVIEYVNEIGADLPIHKSKLKKDYFTSALPWQLKGSAPVLDVTGYGNINIGDMFTGSVYSSQGNVYQAIGDKGTLNPDGAPFVTDVGNGEWVTSNGTVLENQTMDQKASYLNKLFQDKFKNVDITGLGFNADELRVMMAQTRIFERLARCGSRYTEYLYSNFGTAPADETLQRPKYLGGWKIPIVTSEVLQTAEDGETPVGTMRGHGISRGGNKIKDFYAKEFGVLFGLVEVRPKVEYTTGIPRQLTYKSRFDFFNPSFQNLSEQEVRNGELFVDFTGTTEGGVTTYDNDETLGFQAYANELRSSQDEVVADMRDSLKYWGSQLSFATRPNVSGLISSSNHMASFNRPFVQNGSDARNIIVNFYNNLDVYRPMVRFSTPGLVDHF